jgi:hypothetical protein
MASRSDLTERCTLWIRTKRSQSAGGAVAATKWERLYAVMVSHGAILLYKSNADFLEGKEAVSHVNLANGELRAQSSQQWSNLLDKNFKPAKLVFELINVCVTSVVDDGADESGRSLQKEIRTLSLQPETKPEYVTWEGILSTFMRRFGQIETVPLRATSRAGSAAGSSFGGSMMQESVMADVDTSVSWSDMVMKPRWH